MSFVKCFLVKSDGTETVVCLKILGLISLAVVAGKAHAFSLNE